jgi:hypothetical protein
LLTLYAADLTEILGADGYWRLRRPSTLQTALDHPALPRDGFASPLGFWFATAELWGEAITPLRVKVFNRDEPNSDDHNREIWQPHHTAALRSQQAQLSTTTSDARLARSPTSLTLEIDPCTARIRVDADTWQSISQTVLIVISQYWRFLAIDRLLDELAGWSRVDLMKGQIAGVIQRQRSRELRAHRRTLQALLLDLPDFEVLLTNPRACLAPGRSVRICRALTAQLGLEHWRRAIDERIEVIEAVLDSLAESLNHLEALASQLVLELVIVVLLLLDVGLYTWASFAR